MGWCPGISVFGHFWPGLPLRHVVDSPAMECHDPGFRRMLPVLPKPLRCGEQGYSDMVKGFCSPASTLFTAYYSLEYRDHDRMPYEPFGSLYGQLPVRCGTGVFDAEGLVKEPDFMVSKPSSWNPLEGIRSPLWSPCEIIRPPSWNPCEAIRPTSWNPRDACCKCCSPIGNSPSLEKNGTDPSSTDDCPGRLEAIGSSMDDRTMARPPRSSVLSQPANTLLCGGGDRVFKCDHPDCPKSFTRKEELTRHKRTHSNERAFECQICSRKFIRKDHMTKHLATHEDVAKRRRYVCKEPGCSRRYTRSDALSRHRTAAHPEHRPLDNFD